MKRILVAIACITFINIHTADQNRVHCIQYKHDYVTTYSQGRYRASHDAKTNKYHALKDVSTGDSPSRFEALPNAKSIYLELEATYNQNK